MSDDSLTARNRINQRNFRARRQNYIKELEDRLRKYETDGIQATIEMQVAARQAKGENLKLRSLLTQRFGMSDYDISSYLGVSQQSPVPQNHSFPNTIGPNPHFISSASASSGGLTSNPTEMAHSYPTPPQQSDPPRTLTSAHLDPALSLASLHRYPSTSHDQRPFPDSTPSRHDSDLSINQSTNIRSSPYDAPRPDSPTDTLSESSNPATPAEQMHVDTGRFPPSRTESQSTTMAVTAATATATVTAPCCTSNTEIGDKPRTARRNDETSCEEAARIIASMRGGADTNADQVMLELGCSDADARCKVKNISIFQLMDNQT